MSEEGGNGGGGGGDENIPPTPAVTYRAVTAADIGNTNLKFYIKKDGTDKPDPTSTPVDPAIVTEANMAEYVVKDAPVAPVLDDSAAAPKTNAAAPKTNAAAANPALVAEGLPVAQAILNKLKAEDQSVTGAGSGGRRRSRRRSGKKSAKKSKKGGARKSKKGGRSRKNSSKRRAHRKH
jgi:hypothetical protein